MPTIEFAHIDKSFGAVAALRDVTFSIAGGAAHAIVGENGAGKSTLLKTLAGDLHPDGGELRVDGSPVALTNARDALARGIGLVHQEMLAFPNLSVTANIFAGRELTRFGWLREPAMRARARELLARLQIPVTPDAMVGTLRSRTASFCRWRVRSRSTAARSRSMNPRRRSRRRRRIICFACSMT